MFDNTQMTADETTEERTTDTDTPARPLSDRLTEAAVEDLDIDEKYIDFTHTLFPTRDENGELIIEDLNGIVQYNLSTGVLKTTNDFEEMKEVVDHNQHAAANLDTMILG